jgi:hypothetical protein
MKADHRHFKWHWPALALAVALVAALIAAHRMGLQDIAQDTANDAQVQPPSRATVVDNQAVVRLDAATQQRIGTVTTPMAAAVYRPYISATGVVLGAQGLVPLAAAYAQASMHVAQAQAAERASGAEFHRLLRLNQNGKNASDKAVEAARATWQSDQATLDAARQSLQLALLDVQQQWGPVVAAWVRSAAPQLQQLLRQQIFLVQVTVLSNAPHSAVATLELPDGAKVQAHYLSTAPMADPRLQGDSYYYIAAAHHGLLPGISVQVRMQQAARLHGVVVPADAVVLLNGKAWCSVLSGPDQFVRKQVDTHGPAEQGWFVSQNIFPGDRVVTTGAQALLSEEFRQQILMTGD